MSFANEISVAGCVMVIMLAGTARAQTRGAAASGAANPSPGVHSPYGAAVAAPAAVTPTLPTPGPLAPGSSPGLSTPGAGPPPLGGAGSDIRVGAGDLLQVSVYGAPDFDKKTVRISGRGDIVLPFIGEQHVAGLTIEQTQELIARKLSEGQYFNHPQVSVLVLEFISEGASVLGEVQRPGVYPLLVQARLFDLISMAGGVTPRAGKVATITHRRNPGAPEKVTLGNEVQGSTEGNVYVEPGDTVLIAKAGIVYVVGDVHMPGGFVIENGKMTVLEAVAMAQGTLGTAKLDGAKLIRNGDGGQQVEVPIRLKQILASKAPDMSLQPEDILFVPGSVGKSAGKRGLEAIVQAATGAAIYGRY